MMERSPSCGWRAMQQIMHRIRPRNGQERAVLQRLSGCGCQSIHALREAVNTGDESLYTTLSRLEGKGFVFVESAKQIELTDDGRAAIELLAESEVRGR